MKVRWREHEISLVNPSLFYNNDDILKQADVNNKTTAMQYFKKALSIKYRPDIDEKLRKLQTEK
jgi:hypothetical protein